MAQWTLLLCNANDQYLHETRQVAYLLPHLSLFIPQHIHERIYTIVLRTSEHYYVAP